MTGFSKARLTSQGLAVSVAALLVATHAQALTIDFDYASGLSSYFNSNTAALESDVQSVGQNFSSLYSNDVTLHITIQADTSAGALSSSVVNYGGLTTYSTLRAAMVNNATTGASRSTTAALPTTVPASALPGGFRVTTAESKALGLSPANGTATDGTIYVATGANWDFNGTTVPAAGAYSLVDALEHELSELMGRTTNMNQKSWRWNAPMDLLRYTAPGVLSMSAAATGAYFSIDGGTTLARGYNGPNNNYADIQDWASGGVADPYDAYATPGQYLQMTLVDQQVMNTLGWHSPSNSGSIAYSPSNSSSLPSSPSYIGSAQNSLSNSEAVPEPASWALMLVGFGMIGTAVRRQRRLPARSNY